MDIIDEYRHLEIEAQIPQNSTPVENIVMGDTVLFDDINIILEDTFQLIQEDGDALLMEDGDTGSGSSSLMGTMLVESDFLIYEDLINSTSVDKRINIYSRFDAKYIVGNLTTEHFNVHERDGTYFPEGLQDNVAQHVVLE